MAPHDADEDDREETAGLVQAIRHSNPVAAYLIPDFHNPTGRTMSRTPRARVLDAAARQGTVVIADETTAELSIDRPGHFPPMAADGPAVLIGSVGKTVWGGLRVGWIRAERPLIRRLLAVRSPGDLGTPILEQLIVTRLIPTAWTRSSSCAASSSAPVATASRSCSPGTSPSGTCRTSTAAS